VFGRLGGSLLAAPAVGRPRFTQKHFTNPITTTHRETPRKPKLVPRPNPLPFYPPGLEYLYPQRHDWALAASMAEANWLHGRYLILCRRTATCREITSGARRKSPPPHPTIWVGPPGPIPHR
jgi:hypothetical protein